MRVVIDGFPIRVGSAGIGTYTWELLGALTRIAPSHDYYLADMGPRLSAGHVRSGMFPGEYDARVRELVNRVPVAWKALPSGVRSAVTARQAARLGAAAYLGTNFLGVFHRSFRTFITVHDLSHVYYPEGTYPAMYRMLERDLPRHAAKADAVVTDSACTKRDVVAHLGVRPAQVHVAYPGVGDLFRPVTDGDVRDACRRRYGLPARFLLHVGTIEPRKNLLRLLEAFRVLTDDPRFGLDLVLVGGKGWRDAAIRTALDEFPRGSRIVLTGRVPREHLPVLYSMAEVFAFPSLCEGFGLPVLEAMACGTPVVTSTVSALPEVAGDAALLVDPESVPQIAAAIDRLTRDTQLAGSLRERGLIRATAFSWDATARTVLGLLEPIVGS
jgi:glycosyltransferase involved in cell wall biosynthesis